MSRNLDVVTLTGTEYDDLTAAKEERDELRAHLSEAQARLAEIERQEPFAWFVVDASRTRYATVNSEGAALAYIEAKRIGTVLRPMPVYAAPVAQAAQAFRRVPAWTPGAIISGDGNGNAIWLMPAAQAICGCGDTFGEGSVCANCLCGKYVEAGQAVADDLVQYTLTEIERDALLRFNETCDDGEGYDVPKAMMRRLAAVGVVQWVGGSSYGITEIGREIVDAILAAQQQKVKP